MSTEQAPSAGRHAAPGNVSRRRLSAVIASGALLASAAAFAPGAVADDGLIHVTTTAEEVNTNDKCSLQEAIFSANYDDNIAPDPTDDSVFMETGCAPGSGEDTIVLPINATFTMTGPVVDTSNYFGATATPMINSTINIDARGSTLVHGGGVVPYRAFAVAPGAALRLSGVEIRGFEVQGGDGAGGGGGGMGAGGAIYVRKGNLSIANSTFVQNGALGGDGGSGNEYGAGGGGGGIGGDGGVGGQGMHQPGAGGGGALGDGADGTDAGGGGGGTLTDGNTNGRGGYKCGGDTGTNASPDGSDGCDGGGGGGGFPEFTIFDFAGYGGDGGYGGGGGGGGYPDGEGGHGGYGGGGGAAEAFSGVDGGIGGDGGFGGGGGAGDGGIFASGPGSGGTFGGDADERHGGGGAGLGGAIFGDTAAIWVSNSTFYNNYADRGHSGGGDANDGRGAGGAIFLAGGDLTVTQSTFAENATGEYDDTPDGPEGLGGGAIVVYHPGTPADRNFLLQDSILANNGPFECYMRGTWDTGASSNNLIMSNQQNAHGDHSCPGVVLSDDPGLLPLALNKPGVTRTMALPSTSNAIDVGSVYGVHYDQRGVERPQGAAMDIGAYEYSSLPPVTTITLDPASPDGNNGWYVSPVGVDVEGTDVDGVVTETRCVLDPISPPAAFADLPGCSVTTVDGDGEHVVYAASVDDSGNEETPVKSATFKIDATDPTLAPSLNVTTVVVGQTGVVASPNADDATSGLASASCDPVDTSTPGLHEVQCQAEDNAGNTATASATFVVEYRILGFFAPVPDSKWRAGQTVPIKIALGDGNGTRISDAEGRALASACRVTFSSTGAQVTAAQCLKYDAATDQFIYPWKLKKSPLGPTTITVTISYPGTTITTTKSEVISIGK